MVGDPGGARWIRATPSDSAVKMSATIAGRSPNHEAALAHAKKGLLVFPCRPDKRPYTSHGLRDATRDIAEIDKNWTRWPDALVGARCGAENGFWGLDIDVGGGKLGEDSLQELIDAYGPLPDTVEALTPSGGRHLYFRHPRDGRRIPNSASKLGKHLDVRGDGGYVIVPPSVLPDGRSYE